MSLAYKINNKGLSTEPCGTPLSTWNHLTVESKWYTTALSFGSFNFPHFSKYVIRNTNLFACTVPPSVCLLDLPCLTACFTCPITLIVHTLWLLIVII